MDTETPKGVERRGQVTRWVVIVLVTIALVLLLAYARRDPGFDGRVPDPEDAVAALVVDLDGGA